MNQNKIPKGKKIHFEDDLVRVYSDTGKVVYQGILDECPYKYDYGKWNESEGCYPLPNGYRIMGV
jgi:hypothetical protein